MAKRDYTKHIFSLEEWLQGAGKEILKADSFNQTVGEKYKDQVKIGQKMHNMEKELREIVHTMSEVFPNYDIVTTAKGTKFVFMPDGQPGKDFDVDQCPSLEFSRDKNGLVIYNNMVAVNSPIALMNSNNELGFVSQCSLALAETNKQIKASMKEIMTAASKDDRVKVVNRAISRAGRALTDSMSAIYDKKGLDDLRDYNEHSIRTKRPESIKSQQNQLHYSMLIKQMYDKAKELNKLRYDTNLKKFGQEFEEVLNLARALKDVDKVEKALKQNNTRYRDMYKIWNDQLKGFLTPIIKDITQGGMTEGTVGRLGLTEMDIPFISLASTGKKPTQNAQLYNQFTKFKKNLERQAKDGAKAKLIKTTAIGSSKIFTEGQKKLLDQGAKSRKDSSYAYKDLYGVAYISEDVLQKAWEEIKTRYDDAREKFKNKKISRQEYNQATKKFNLYREQLLKGFGEDSSFMSSSMAKEFAQVTEWREFKDIDIKDVNEKMKKSLLRKLRSTKPTSKISQADIDKEIDFVSKKFNYFELTAQDRDEKRWYLDGVDMAFNNAMRSIYGLASRDLIGDTGKSGKPGFLYDYKKSQGKITNVHAARRNNTSAMVMRVGATGDFRSNMASMEDDVMKLVLRLAYGLDEKTANNLAKKNQLEYLNADGSLKINVLRSASGRGFSGKTIATDIKEALNWATTFRDHAGSSEREKAVAQQFKALVGKNPLLNKFMSYDNNGDLIVDNTAVDKYFSDKRENSQEFQHGVAKYYSELMEALVQIGAYSSAKVHYIDDPNVLREIYGESYDPTKDGPILASTGVMVGATEIGKSSTPEYAGGGDKTTTGHSITWRERQTLENTKTKIEQRLLYNGLKGKRFEEAMKPINRFAEAIEDGFKESKAEWDRHVTATENMANTWHKNVDEAKREIARDQTLIRITYEDMLQFDADYAYDSEGINPGHAAKITSWKDVESNIANGKHDADFAVWAKHKAVEKFRQLKKEKGTEWMAQRGIKSYKDLMNRFYIDFGDNRIVGTHNGQALTTGAAYLPYIGYNEKELAKNGVLMLDDGARIATNIVRAAKDMLDGKRGVGPAAQNAVFSAIIHGYDSYRESMTKGGIYHQTNEYRGDKASGRFKTLGLSDFSANIFTDMANQIVASHKLDANSEEVKRMKESLADVQMIMNIEDYKAMWRSRLHDGKTREKAQEELTKMFESLYTVEQQKKLRSGKHFDMLDAVAAAYDITNKGYKGSVISDVAWNRDPTINFIRDVNGGSMVLAGKSLVGQGNIMINKNLLSVGHGDMDGDLIAMYLAFQDGDEKRFETALDGYFKSAAIQQGKIDEEEKAKDVAMQKALVEHFKSSTSKADINNVRLGDVNKVNSVQDLAGKNITVGAMWNAKAGAGIFGDAVFSVENLLHPRGIKDLDYNGKNGVFGLGGAALHAVFQTLYQEGINIKNAANIAKKLGITDFEGRADQVAYLAMAQSDKMFEALNHADTFDNINSLRRFIETGETLGAFDLKKMFKGNTLGSLDLNTLDKKGIKQLLEFAKQHRDTLDPNLDKKYYDLISEDIAQLESGQYSQMSSEMVAALILALNNSEYFGVSRGTIGSHFANRYLEGLTGKKGREVPKLNKAIGETYDDITEKLIKKFSDEEKKDFYGNTTLGRYQAIKNGKFNDTVWGRAATTVNRQALIDSKYGLSPDIMNLASEIMKAAEVEDFDKNKYLNALNTNGLSEVIRGVLVGSIVHGTSDALSKHGEDFKNNEEYKQNSEKWARQLRNLYGEEAVDLFNKAQTRGQDTYRTIQKMVDAEGGTIVGTELNLAGGEIGQFGDIRTTRGSADIVYRVGNKLVVGDIKNYSDGALHLDGVLQVADYVERLKHLQMAMEETRAVDASALWDMGDKNNIVRNWRRYLEDQVLTEEAVKQFGADQVYTEDKEQQRKIEEWKNQNRTRTDLNEEMLRRFAIPFDAISRGEPIEKMMGRIMVNAGNGLLKYYDVDTSNPYVSNLLTRWRQSAESKTSFEDFIEKEGPDAQVLFSQATHLAGIEFTGGAEDQQKHFSEQFKKLVAKQEEITKQKNKRIKIMHSIRMKNDQEWSESLQNSINADQDKLEQIDAIINTLEEEYRTMKGDLYTKEENQLVVDGRRTNALEVLDPAIKESEASARSIDNAHQAMSDWEIARNRLSTFQSRKAKVLQTQYQTEAALQQNYSDSYKKQLQEAKKLADANIKNLNRQRKEALGAVRKKDENGKYYYVDSQGIKIEDPQMVKEFKEFAKDVSPADKKKMQEEAAKEAGFSYVKERKKFSDAYREARKAEIYLDEEINGLKEAEKEAHDKGDDDSAKIYHDRLLERAREKELRHLDMPEGYWENYAGYSKEERDRIEEILQLEAKKRQEKKLPNGNNGGQGGGVGFLGMDAFTSRLYSRLMNGGMIYTFIRTVRKGLHDITEKAKQLDQAMTNLRIVTGKNGESARTLIGQYAELGKKLGATTIEVTNAATAWFNESRDHAIINSLNCWEFLKIKILQHNDEICVSVKVEKF